MILAFTGPVEPQGGMAFARKRLDAMLKQIDPDVVKECRTGAAYGVDTAAFFACLRHFPNAKHRVMVPQGKRYNDDVVLHAKQEGHEVIGISGGYLKRDDALIQYPIKGGVPADVLLAFPDSMTEKLRSGTWSTIRRAWKKGVTVWYRPADLGVDIPHQGVVRCT